MNEYDLICCVVNSGQGSKVLRIAKNNGIEGGTICMGRGTVKSKLLEFLDLDDIRKEIVFMAAKRDIAEAAAKSLDKGLSFRKPNHGIAFSIPLTNFIGARRHEYHEICEDETVNDMAYSAIFTIVDRGRGDDVIAAGKQAGARGGTVINARGSGIHETSVLFAMPIEPEKEMVMILAKNDVCPAIAASIREQLRIDEPGNGIIFTIGIREAYGLY